MLDASAIIGFVSGVRLCDLEPEQECSLKISKESFFIFREFSLELAISTQKIVRKCAFWLGIGGGTTAFVLSYLAYLIIPRMALCHS